jgi:diguanylate cyclase (GGDEF)-like protein
MQTQSSTQEMIKELKEVKSVFSNIEKSEPKSYSHELEQQAKLDLAMALQMSLDLDWVINKFMEHIHAYFLFDGYSYRCADPAVEIKNSRQKGHSCSYNLHIQDIDLGTLVVFRGRKFAESELMLLESLLSILIYPLRNAAQFKQAISLAHRDALTGVNNRSTFDDSLGREINLAHRHDQDFSLLVIDIDFFKKVNDTYGHQVGDDALKAVAETIQNSIRATDMLFRYGGEEFVVLLGNTDCDQSYFIADRILESVREIEVQVEERLIDLTVSIGMACLNILDTSESLFSRADAAMYSAKNDGRDQIIVA